MVPAPILALEVPPSPWSAAFDADGTLWHGDVSEDFTRWMIEAGHFDRALWPAYASVAARDAAAACFEILRFYRGMPMALVRARVAEFWCSQAGRRTWRLDVLAAVRFLTARGAQVFVVSGTPAPVFGDLANALGIAGILALDLETDADDRATGRHRGTATVGDGKATRLRASTSAPCLVAVGNSAIDAPLLRASHKLAWAVAPDAALAADARRHGWLVTGDGGE
jgi:HAD superfamily phosphoserine phosphatase-like hydrolase